MQETFWLKASHAKRKALFRVLKDIADTTGRSFDDIVLAATGWAPDEGAKYIDNARAGRMDRKKCAVAHRWIRENHPKHAFRLDAEIGFIETVPTPASGFLAHKPMRPHHFGCAICEGRKPKGISMRLEDWAV